MKAVDYFLQGYSCSESIIKSAIDKGYVDKAIFPIATGFSGGISSGCICGAVSASIIVISYIFGKENKYSNDVIAKTLAKQFIDTFKASHNVTCCRVLTKNFEFQSSDRKSHCANLVEFCEKTLEDIIKINAGTL